MLDVAAVQPYQDALIELLGYPSLGQRDLEHLLLGQPRAQQRIHYVGLEEVELRSGQAPQVLAPEARGVRDSSFGCGDRQATDGLEHGRHVQIVLSDPVTQRGLRETQACINVLKELEGESEL